MIFHLSIPALDPEHVSGILARLLGGEDFSFHAFPDGRIVLTGDEHGTAVVATQLAKKVQQTPSPHSGGA